VLLDVRATPALVGVAELGEVLPRAEASTGPGEEDRSDAVIVAGRREGVDQLVAHGLGQRVQLVGPLQGDPQDGAVAVGLDLLEPHA
jgi:hypothetical protein